MPLDPRQVHRGIILRAILVGVAQAAVWIGVGVAVIEVGTLCEKVLRDFKAELPSISKTAIGMNHLLYDFWYLLLPPLLVLPLLHYAVASWTDHRGEATLRSVWCVVTWLAPALVLIFFLLAYLLPIMRLFSSLQGR
jgi:hypothetical protein